MCVKAVGKLLVRLKTIIVHKVEKYLNERQLFPKYIRQHVDVFLSQSKDKQRKFLEPYFSTVINSPPSIDAFQIRIITLDEAF